MHFYSQEECDYINKVKQAVAKLYLIKLNKNTYKIKSYYLAKRYKGHCISYSNENNELLYLLDADRHVIISKKSGRQFDVAFANCCGLDDYKIARII